MGCTDAKRNCISNVRGAGLAPQAAALRLYQLMSQARSMTLTGVALKIDTLELERWSDKPADADAR